MADGFHKLAPATGVGLALLGLSEVAHARAAGKPIPPCDRSAVVVLGFPNRRNGGIHPVQRWRVRLALQTFAAHNGARLVFTGGETRGTKSEAETMADEAVAQGANRAQIVIEGRATSTWENVYLTMPLVKDFDTVILVSDPIHAARAKLYWLQQHPADDGRVFVTDQCGPVDGWWLKVPTAAIGLVRLAQARFKQHRIR